jgi:hypothetical protein
VLSLTSDDKFSLAVIRWARFSLSISSACKKRKLRLRLLLD